VQIIEITAQTSLAVQRKLEEQQLGGMSGDEGTWELSKVKASKKEHLKKLTSA